VSTVRVTNSYAVLLEGDGGGSEHQNMKQEALHLASVELESPSDTCGKHKHQHGKRNRLGLNTSLRRNGSGSGRQARMTETLRAAQRAGVTQMEYLRAHVLLGAGIDPRDEWPDEGISDEQC